MNWSITQLPGIRLLFIESARHRIWQIVLGIVVISFVAQAAIYWSSGADQAMQDWDSYTHAARQIWDGESPYTAEQLSGSYEGRGARLYVYHPSIAFMLGIFNSISTYTAGLIFLALSLVIATWGWVKLGIKYNLSRDLIWLSLIAWLLWPETARGAGLGQVTILMTGLLALFWVYAEHERGLKSWISPLCLALTILMRVTPALFLLYILLYIPAVAARQYLFRFALVLGGLIVIPHLILDNWSLTVDFVVSLLNRDLFSTLGGQNLALLARMEMLGLTMPHLTIYLLSAILVIGAICKWRQGHDRGATWGYLVWVWLITSPVIWGYYLALLLLAWPSLWRARSAMVWSAVVIAYAAYPLALWISGFTFTVWTDLAQHAITLSLLLIGWSLFKVKSTFPNQVHNSKKLSKQGLTPIGRAL